MIILLLSKGTNRVYLKMSKKLYTGIYLRTDKQRAWSNWKVASVFVKKLDSVRTWPGLKNFDSVQSQRQIIRHNHIEVKTRHVITSLHWNPAGIWYSSEIIVKTKFIMLETLPRRDREFVLPLTSFFCHCSSLLSIYIVTKCLKIWRKLNDYAPLH